MGKIGDPREMFLSGYLEAEKRLSLKRQKAAESAEAPVIEAEAAQLLLRRAEVLTAIESAPTPIMRTVLEARYINGLKWADVGNLVGYSTENAWRVHKKALKAMRFPAYVK